jgi:N-methylhydantoinase B/oxoprolinase/acetone carboxylase alpha subunit
LDVLADHICNHSREAVLAEIAKLPKGSWRNMMVVDGYEAPVTFEVEVTISDTGIHVDFTGTSSASKYGITCRSPTQRLIPTLIARDPPSGSWRVCRSHPAR